MPPQVTSLPQGIQITNTLIVYPAGSYPAEAAAAQPTPPTVIINTPPAGATQLSPPPTPGAQPPQPPPTPGRVEERGLQRSEERRSGQPAGVKYEHRLRSGLLASGATLFLLSYGLTVVSAASFSTGCNELSDQLGCTTNRWPLFIPVAGPFIQMGYLSGTNSGTARALLAMDGVIQAGGAAMALLGLLIPKKVAVPTVFAGRMRLSPYSGFGGSGLMATAAF